MSCMRSLLRTRAWRSSPFTWRKKWSKSWDDFKYSDLCRRRK